MSRINVSVFIVVCISVMGLLCGCGSPKGVAENRAPAVQQNDSLMALFNDAESDTALQATASSNPLGDSIVEGAIARAVTGGTRGIAQKDSGASVVSAISGGAQKKIDTVGTLEEAIARNATIVVDSGSAEDLRLDSLMALAWSKSYEYQRYVMTHSHKSLAASAHQDIAKQKRLLKTIAENTKERQSDAQRAKFLRAQRTRELKGLPLLPDPYDSAANASVE